MIDPRKFIQILKKNKINFFSGTPDSVLSNFLEVLKNEKNFYVAPHEGIAVSAGIGYNFATAKIPCVFMQNSGLGNILNPISSIAHKKIFKIPMIIIIGMRGYKGDEPQHLIQIKSTPKILKESDIEYFYLDTKTDLNKQINKAVNMTSNNKMPIAILIKKNSFDKILKTKKIKLKSNIKKYSSYNDYVNTISNYVKKEDYVLSATGFLHRTVFYNREKFKTKNFFYNIGGMGHLSNIAYITALIKKKSNIFCLEGDGSFLMHLGSQLLVSKNKLRNFKYFLFNYNSHYSTGGQIQSNINNIDLKIFAKSIKLNYFKFDDSSKLNNFLQKNKKGNLFIELKCNNSHITDLPRPKLDQISFGK